MYRIRDWDKNFENNKSRERDRCSYICLPNKSGLGKRHLLRMPNGGRHFAIFVLLAEACSRQRRPRDGYLTDTGRADGRSLDMEDLSELTDHPVEQVKEAVEALIHHKVGWIQELNDECPSSAREVPAECPLREGKGMEGKEGKEDPSASAEGGVSTSAKSQTPASPSDDSPVVLVFPCKAGKRSKAREWQLRQSFIDELKDSCPFIDVAAQCKKALAYVRASAERLHTADGMKAYLTRWINREDRWRLQRLERGVGAPTSNDFLERVQRNNAKFLQEQNREPR